jgi:hypothetical protein
MLKTKIHLKVKLKNKNGIEFRIKESKITITNTIPDDVMVTPFPHT